MSAIKAVRRLLLNNISITGMIGQKVYGNVIPQGVLETAVKLQVMNVEPSDTKDGRSELDVYFLQVTIFSPSAEDASELDEKIRDVIDRYRGVVAGVDVEHIVFITSKTGWDDDAKEHRVDTDYKIRINK